MRASDTIFTAVGAGSCGPGNLHLINGLYECHRNRVPVLAIAAQIPSPEIGGGYFQQGIGRRSADRSKEIHCFRSGELLA